MPSENVERLHEELEHFDQAEVRDVGTRIHDAIGHCYDADGMIDRERRYEEALEIVVRVLRLRDLRFRRGLSVEEARLLDDVESGELRAGAYWVVDETNRIWAVTRSAAELLDLEPLELVGRNGFEYAHDGERASEIWAEQTLTGTVVGKRANGRPRRIRFEVSHVGRLRLIRVEAAAAAHSRLRALTPNGRVVLEAPLLQVAAAAALMSYGCHRWFEETCQLMPGGLG